LTGQLQAAERQLELALAEARRVHRPVLESQILAHWALVALAWSLSTGEQRARDAIEVARTHGWEGRDSAAFASLIISVAMLLRGRLEEAERWLAKSEIGIVPGGPPTTALLFHGTRALLEFARGRHEQALEAYRAYEWAEELVVTRHLVALRFRSDRLTMMTRLGQFEEGTHMRHLYAKLGVHSREKRWNRHEYMACCPGRGCSAKSFGGSPTPCATLSRALWYSLAMVSSRPGAEDCLRHRSEARRSGRQGTGCREQVTAWFH
jgi:ATP/maltotriose-dependent transcriptional regulator MalT